MSLRERAKREMGRLAAELTALQQTDGTWRMCAETGPMTNAYMIVLLRALGWNDEPFIAMLSERLAKRQQPNGAWRLYEDEPDGGSLSATVEAYFALLYAGVWKPEDETSLAAQRFIRERGGLARASLLTKVMLALNGRYAWRNPFLMPIELMLVPDKFPLNLYEISGHARVHIVPVLVAAHRKFSVVHPHTPQLTELDSKIRRRHGTEPSKDQGHLQNLIGTGLKYLHLKPQQLEEKAMEKAEQFMLDRIESDGTLYSYFSSTWLMIYALLALEYDRHDVRIVRAVEGLKRYVCRTEDRTMHVQNFTSTVWDTSLIAHALQEAGVPPSDPTVRKAGMYLLGRQHTKSGDWARHAPNTEPGGWGFSDINTFNPDVDDTTAALRAIRGFVRGRNRMVRDAWDRGLNWLLSMQNSDGGWAAFEKNTDMKMLTWLPVEHAADFIVDPSSADLTGRTLEFLGRYAGLRRGIPLVDRAVGWLLREQEPDGSWYGRWGICYLYGTWAALTGLIAVGIPADHPSVRRAVRWLLSVQRDDGGFGESCLSDVEHRFVPLGFSTPSQTAWATDALLAVHGSATPEIEQAVERLIAFGSAPDGDKRALSYPTGAGLPGSFYLHYHSYRRAWPLIALANFVKAAGT